MPKRGTRQNGKNAKGNAHVAGVCCTAIFVGVSCSASEDSNSSFVKVLFVRLCWLWCENPLPIVAYSACVGLQLRPHSAQHSLLFVGDILKGNKQKKTVSFTKKRAYVAQYVFPLLSRLVVFAVNRLSPQLSPWFFWTVGISLGVFVCLDFRHPTPRRASTSPTRQTKLKTPEDIKYDFIIIIVGSNAFDGCWHRPQMPCNPELRQRFLMFCSNCHCVRCATTALAIYLSFQMFGPTKTNNAFSSVRSH